MTSTAVATDLRVHALGAVRVTREGSEVPLGGPRQRRLLAVLLIHHGSVTSVDRIAEAVFAGEPTDAAATTLRSYVARLRRVLGEDAVLTRAPGYQLALPAEAFDVTVFEAGVQQGRAALQRQEPVVAAELARGALDLWEGEAYAEFADEEWALVESQRLSGLRLLARELLAEAQLEGGHTSDVLPMLELLCREHPLRETLRGLLMTAYYRAGRQADALAEMRAFRAELAEELGIDPSPALVGLEGRILAQDPSLAPAGEPLRGYRLGERLGTGHEGTVHAAHLPGVERELVVKTLRAEVADAPAFVRSFEAVAHRVASLAHPAILPIHDYWREPGAAYVVTPRLRGGTLRDRLQRGPLDRPELVTLVERIGGALARACSADLAHGRLAPQNVLYDDAGAPFLADFWLGGAEAPDPVADVLALADLVRLAARPGTVPGPLLADPPEDVERLVADLLAALGRPAEAARAANPYQGLQAFDEADADNYFGRTGLIDDVAGRLAAGIRLVLLVGASGTGKSSAVRAGLLPRLRAGPRTGQWFVATMLPAGSPYVELAAALNRIAVTPTTGLADRMAGDGDDGIDAALREVVPQGGQVLLVVDQFEELFTLSSEAEQRSFLSALTAAIAAPDSRLRVVATLRADFYDRPLAVQPFGSLVSEATVAIPAMLPAEVEAAVVEPARRAGREVERALAAELVGSVASEPAALPALQFVLFELAERSAGGGLTLADYQELGGLDGAIAARAEELYQSLDDADRAHVRELFERLVVVGEGEPTRRRATRDEVASAAPLVDAWAAARLLTLDVHPQTRVPTVEVAHEALVREWPRLREWIEEDRSELVVLARLRESARAWDELDRDPAALLRGTALQAAVDVAARRVLPPLERTFVEEGRVAAEEEQAHQVLLIRRQSRINRRLRWQLGGIGVLLVLALVGGFVALDQRREADVQRHNATARELAAAANEGLVEDPERSTLLALAAVQESRRNGDRVLPEAAEALHRAVASNRLVRFFPDEGGALDWSDDGRFFATEGPEETGLVTVRDARTGSALRQWRAEKSDLNEVDFSPDARWIASAGDDGALRVWQTATGTKVSEVRGSTSRVVATAFSPDGRLVAAAWPEEGVVRVVRPESGQVVRTLEVAEVSAVDFSPDSRRIALSVGEPQVVVHDLRTGRRVRTYDDVYGTFDVKWSPDGHWVAVPQAVGSVVVFDARTGERRFETYGHQGPVNSVAWSRDGRLATGSNDGSVRVFTIRGGALVESQVLSAHALHDGVRDLAWSPDATELMATSWSITGALVFDMRPEAGAEVRNLSVLAWGTRSVALAPDGRSAWVVQPDASVARLDLVTGRPVQRLSLPVADEEPPRLWLSPDGSRLAVAAQGYLGPLPVLDARTGAIDAHVDVPLVDDVVWAPDGRHLAVSYPDEDHGVVVVADRRGRQVVRVAEQPGTWTMGMSFTDSGRLLALLNGPDPGHPRDRRITLWDWRAERRVREIPANSQQIAAGRRGGLLVSTRVLQGVVDVFDTATGKQVAELEGHAGVVTGVDVDSTGTRVATAGADGSARIWDARTGTLLSALRGPQVIGDGQLAFSEDGHRLVTTWGDGIARVWTLDLDELVRIAQGRLTRTLTTAECRTYLHVESCPRAGG